jgi:hypothetical protein
VHAVAVEVSAGAVVVLGGAWVGSFWAPTSMGFPEFGRTTITQSDRVAVHGVRGFTGTVAALDAGLKASAP